MEENRMDYARVFLNKKGGYSMSELYSELRRDADGNPILPNYKEGGIYDDEV